MIVVVDDLGRRSVEDANTPNLDRLRWRAEAFYSMLNCSPARIRLMTGRRPIPEFGIGTLVRPLGLHGIAVTLKKQLEQGETSS